MLTLKSSINFLCVETHNDGAVNDDYRCGHVAEFLEVRHRVRVMRDVSLLEMDAFLRKILLRLIAEYSTLLRINDDVLRHCPPPGEFAGLTLKC